MIGARAAPSPRRTFGPHVARSRWPVGCALATVLGAQQGPPDKQVARAATDLRALPGNLNESPHAFAGLVVFFAAKDSQGRTFEYSILSKDGLHLLHCGDWQILSHGVQQLTRPGNDAEWREPQGDAPDCPLLPTHLARHFEHGEVVAVQPATHEDRPAMVAHVVWTAPAPASALVGEVSVPDGKLQRFVETLPRLLLRAPREQWVVDAAITYDPATRTMLAAVVRIVILEAAPLPADVLPPPHPRELPPLRQDRLLELHIRLTRRPAGELRLPDLTPDHRQKLGLR